MDIDLYACIRLHYALIFQKWVGGIKEATIKMQYFQAFFTVFIQGTRRESFVSLSQEMLKKCYGFYIMFFQICEAVGLWEI